MIDGLDHVQLAMPSGGEELARVYFGGMLGLAELGVNRSALCGV